MLANLTNRECDRFIHQRNYFKTHHSETAPTDSCNFFSNNYNYLVKKRLFSIGQTKDQLFTPNNQITECYNLVRTDSFQSSKLSTKITSPIKILDVPKYKDDFYLNNIDWSRKGPLGIALQNEVFLYTPDNITQISHKSYGPLVSGLKIFDELMAVGNTNGMIQLYDLERGSLIRSLFKHENRVAALMFLDGLLVSGSKDKSIVLHDLRLRDHAIKEFMNHKGEVCALKAKNQTQKIFASGSTDGSAIIWDLKYGFIDQLKGHKGAVKALDWCPWKSSILAAGGGNEKEKTIKVWNTTNSKLLCQQSIQSQISGIVWNQQLKLLISSHGYSENQINFWNLGCKNEGRCFLQNKKNFKAHSGRILNMLQSHNGNYLCTVGADQSLKFWGLQQGNCNPFEQYQSDSKRQQLQFRI